MKNANTVLFAALLALGVGGCRGGQATQEAPAPVAVKTVADYFDIGLGGRTVRLQVAVRLPEMERGLMERRQLARDEGMIFVYATPQQMSFWMHDTPTPLDIGFFGPDGVLAEVYPLLPFDERTVASRSMRLQFAIEMNQGWYAANDIRPGARLDLAELSAAMRARGFDPKAYRLPE
jgi:uncharacterized membrane protein (UPF0127 family)